MGCFVVGGEACAALFAGQGVAGDQSSAYLGEATRAGWATMDVGSYQTKGDILVFLPPVNV